MGGQFAGKVKLVFEDFGESALTDRYDIKGYPAVFVDGRPVALPVDFGYAAGDVGKYTPWANADSQKRFADDLAAALSLAVEGKPFDEYVREADGRDPYPERLPALRVTDSTGKTFDFAALAGRIVIVDFWATWCPPCRRSLPEVAALQDKYGDRLAVVTVCVGSPADEMERVHAQLAPGLPVIAGTDDIIAAFGNVVNVPTLMVFDRQGRRNEVIIGAPEELPGMLERLLEEMLK